jgi:RimJ/RimL family protein N-acetyltransferase
MEAKMHEVLTTDRLALRPLKTADAADFARLVNNSAICRMTGTFPYPFPKRSVEGRVQIFCSQAATGHAYHWAIIWQDQFVGVVGLFGQSENREIGYWLGEPFWGQGLMKEALVGLIDHIVQKNPDVCLKAGVFTDNHASAHLLKNVGFKQSPDVSRGYSLARGQQDDIWTFFYLADKNAGDPPASVDLSVSCSV